MNKFYLSTVITFLLILTGAFAEPSITSTGLEQLPVYGAAGLRGSIAVDSANQPHIVMTTAPGNMFYFCDYTGGGFSCLAYNSTAIFNSPLFGSAHIEIDSADTAWISSTFWYPNMGIGITVRPQIKNRPGDAPSFNTEDIWGGGTYDVANLSLDPEQVGKCYFGSHLGNWEEYTFNPGSWSIFQSGSGSVNDGAGGEKAYFWVSKAGNFPHADGSHAVKHHATEWSYNNSVRAAAGQPYQRWSNWDYYPGMLNDHAYPACVSDNIEPQVAYMAAEYTQKAPYGIYLNIWRGSDGQGNGYFQFSPNGGLLCLDPNGRTGVGGRYEVQMYPANHGGVWVSWIRDGRAKMRYVPSMADNINDCGPEYDICAATVVSAICVDKNGDIHMAYIANNAVQYRKIGVSGDGTSLSKQCYTPCDFDGNGYDDLCLYYPEKGIWNIWYMYNGTLGMQETRAFGFAETHPAPADFDGDGKTDLAVYYPKNGEWIVQNSRGGALWSMQWGWEETLPVPADYNGNGQDNVAVFYPEQGLWYIDAYYGREGKTVKLGFSEAIPVPADYNGDGRDDIAIYVPENGLWVAMDVESGEILLNQNWGWEGARPVPADFSGNGKADLCVFYASAGNWYCDFRNGVSRTLHFGGGGMLPVPGRYRSAANVFNNAQIGIYYPENGTWALKELLLDFVSPWTSIVQFGWNEAFPPAFMIEQ